jgi:hypothetical protein
MTFEAFIESAWNEHGDQPQVVADRLQASLDLVQQPEHIAPFARLAVHLYGEHLGDWQRGIDMLDALRHSPAFDHSAAVDEVLMRSNATLRFAMGDEAALAALPIDARIAAMATASSIFAGRDAFKRAIGTYEDAIALAEARPPAPASPAIRALAVAGNNLAAALEARKDRDAVETAGMVSAARGGLAYWKQAGTWLEEERAEYRLARSLLQAGDAPGATAAATRCVAVCLRNAAPPFELFFAYAVLALAARAAGNAAASDEARSRAMAAHAQVPADEQAWCAADRDELLGQAP